MKGQSTPIINQYIALALVNPFENFIGSVEKLGESIISDLDLNVVKKLSYMFSPKGITLAYILSESHLVIHTWPELGTIHVDLVTCVFRTKKEFEKALKHALDNYDVRSIKVKAVNIDKP